jgi:ATP-dependent DNA helicase UvrD/PcrA
VALRKMHETARTSGVPPVESAAILIASGGLKGRVRENMDALLRALGRWRALAEMDGHVVAVATLLNESGYIEMWQQDKSPEAPERVENLRELATRKYNATVSNICDFDGRYTCGP